MEAPEGERRIDRIDRKLGMTWSRIGGAVFAMLGLLMLSDAFGGDAPLDRWPLLLGAAAMSLLARLCFRSRSSMSELLDEGAWGAKKEMTEVPRKTRVTRWW